MIWVLGSSGYIGQAFVRELKARGLDFCSLSLATFDYMDRRLLEARLAKEKPALVIQAAGFTGRPNVDACETMRVETLQGNLALTLTVAEACAATGVRMGHVSSGCIFTGAKFMDSSGSWQAHESLIDAGASELLAARSKRVSGFQEQDCPTSRFAKTTAAFTAARRLSQRRRCSPFRKHSFGVCESLLMSGERTEII